MFIINWINLAWSHPVKPTNCIHVAKCKTLPYYDTHHEKNLHCSLTVFNTSSSLLVLNNYNERVCGKKNGNFFLDF